MIKLLVAGDYFISAEYKYGIGQYTTDPTDTGSVFVTFLFCDGSL